MAKHKEEKTNVMRVLDQKKIPYTAHTYDPEGPASTACPWRRPWAGPRHRVQDPGGARRERRYYVFDIPVAENLDLKKAAKAVGRSPWPCCPRRSCCP